jgi:hypothetical protein
VREGFIEALKMCFSCAIKHRDEAQEVFINTLDIAQFVLFRKYEQGGFESGTYLELRKALSSEQEGLLEKYYFAKNNIPIV